MKGYNLVEWVELQQNLDGLTLVSQDRPGTETRQRSCNPKYLQLKIHQPMISRSSITHKTVGNWG